MKLFNTSNSTNTFKSGSAIKWVSFNVDIAKITPHEAAQLMQKINKALSKDQPVSVNGYNWRGIVDNTEPKELCFMTIPEAWAIREAIDSAWVSKRKSGAIHQAAFDGSRAKNAAKLKDRQFYEAKLAVASAPRVVKHVRFAVDMPTYKKVF